MPAPEESALCTLAYLPAANPLVTLMMPAREVFERRLNLFRQFCCAKAFASLKRRSYAGRLREFGWIIVICGY